MKTKISKEKIIEVCKASNSMAKAAADLKIHFNTLKIEKNLYDPNGTMFKNRAKPSHLDITTSNSIAVKLTGGTGNQLFGFFFINLYSSSKILPLPYIS